MHPGSRLDKMLFAPNKRRCSSGYLTFFVSGFFERWSVSFGTSFSAVSPSPSRMHRLDIQLSRFEVNFWALFASESTMTIENGHDGSSRDDDV